jgi:hypothetical protein
MIWTILGVSVAIVAVFCISVAETLVGKPIFEGNRHYIAAVLVVAGVAAWFVGRHLGDRRRTTTNVLSDEEESGSRSFVLLDLRYWGPMLLVLGVITLFIRPLRSAPVAAAAPRREPPKVAIVTPPRAPEPVKKAPVRFPPLKMQGVIFRETQPFAIINGESYTIGDHVGEVQIKAIDRTGVVLELSGEVKLLSLN